MKLETHLEIGQHVTINKDISKTDSLFDSCAEMRMLAGSKRIFRIKEIEKRRHGVAVTLVNMSGKNRYDCYIWHPNDLTVIGVEDKPEQNFLFDATNL